jgi:hypothetical protein
MPPVTGIQIVFWQELYPPGEARRELAPCPAIVVGASTQICAVCREPEAGHSARRNRRHAFAPMEDPGLTLDVTYVNGEKGRRENVQLGKLANCWTETENLPVIHGTMSAKMAETITNLRKGK